MKKMANENNRAEHVLAHLIARGDRQVEPTTAHRKLAHHLLLRYGSLAPVVEAHAQDLMDAERISNTTSRLISIVPQLARYLDVQRYMGEKQPITNWRQAGDLLRAHYIGIHYERVHLLCLDENGFVLGCPLAQQGTLDETPFYLRNILEIVSRLGAKLLVLSHNHPGGTTTPSPADLAATRRAIKGVGSVDVCLLDHILIAEDEPISIFERELIPRQDFLNQKIKSPIQGVWA